MIPFMLAALFLYSGVAPANDPAGDEAKKLQGEWRVVEAHARGKKAGKDDAEFKDMRFTFNDGGLTVGAGGADRKKTFTLDPTKSPKQIDLTSLDGQEKDTTAACIYKFEKDRLTICIPYFVADSSVRPKEFKAGADDGLMLITLERVKDK